MPASLVDKVSEAVTFIREHEPEGGYVLGFSGGKDSIVTYHLAKIAGVSFKPYLSLVPGNDNPDVLSFVRENYPDVTFTCRRGKGFAQQVVIKGLPSFRQRWCCEKFKEASFYSRGKYLLLGLRAEESRARAGRPRIDPAPHGTTFLKPVFYWTEADIWEFIDTLDLKYPSLYDTGYTRVGCIICPYSLSGTKPAIRKMIDSMNQYRANWIAVKRAAQKFFVYRHRKYDSFDEYWRHFLVGFRPDMLKNLEGVDVPV